jgi:alanine racemase
MDKELLSTWLEIDLGAIKNNIQQLHDISKKPVMAVVKANAYGHGLVEVAKSAQAAGVSWLGVARIEEAMMLRNEGLNGRILVLGYTPPTRIQDAIAKNISLTVADYEVAKAYARQAALVGGELMVHAKFDTGMGRLGVFPEEGLDFVKLITEEPGLSLEGMFTHFARADEPGLSTTDQQLDRFDALLRKTKEAGIRPQWIHACNSAGSIYFPRGYYDMVRSGIAVYGFNPSPEAVLPKGFRPAMSWKARLISVKMLPAGHGVSYNHHYFTTQSQRVGVVAIGYSDGFRRRLGNYVLVHGKRVEVLGMVCMDQCMVNLDQIPDANIGDEVVLMGTQGEASISADELAADWGTINYEVICGMTARVPRIYID